MFDCKNSKDNVSRQIATQTHHQYTHWHSAYLSHANRGIAIKDWTWALDAVRRSVEKKKHIGIRKTVSDFIDTKMSPLQLCTGCWQENNDAHKSFLRLMPISGSSKNQMTYLSADIPQFTLTHFCSDPLNMAQTLDINICNVWYSKIPIDHQTNQQLKNTKKTSQML